MAAGSARPSRRWLALARLLFALGILAWVGRSLPWSDELSYFGADGRERKEPGRIEGDWTGDLVRFHPEDPARIDPSWPAEARAEVARGDAVLARRREEGAPGYDWHPGMPRAFREMDLGGLILAEILFVLATLTIVTRWWRLLALAGCATTWRNALRLTFLGLFFNNVMPGATGGDLVKGVLVAKENPGRGADALVTVLVDRVFGMIALALLALFVILAVPGPFDGLRSALFTGLGVCALGTVLYASKSFRRRAGLSALVDRLPMAEKLRSVDRAALIYLRRPLPIASAFLFSFVNHVLVTLGVFVLGGALGVARAEVGLVDYLVLVPVANLISAIPLAPGGWGVGELAFSGLFQMIGASAALGVAVSVTFRLSQLGIGLLGGVFLLLPRSRTELRQARGD